MTKDIEREAFIEWALLNNFDVSEVQTEEIGALFIVPSIQSAWMGWISCARAKQEKLEGCVVVPVEPTEEMYLAGVKANNFKGSTLDVWSAMLEAARGGNE